jgi:surface protein
VSSVTNMSSMFYNDSSFNQPLDNWDVSSVSNMNSMFSGNTELNRSFRVWTILYQDVSLNYAFAGSNVYPSNDSIGPLIDSSGTPLSNYFSGLFILNDSNFYKALDYYFKGTPYNFTDSELSLIGRFADSESKDNISFWNVSAVTNMRNAFVGKGYFNMDINNWDVSLVTDMSYMFSGCFNFNMPLNLWNVSSVLNMRNMFYNCKRFNQYLDWDVSSVNNMSYMFSKCLVMDNHLRHWNVKISTLINNATNMFDKTSISIKDNDMNIIIHDTGTPVQNIDEVTSYKNYFTITTKLSLSSNSMFYMALNYYFNSIAGTLTQNERDLIGQNTETNSSSKANIVYWNVSEVTDMSGAFKGRTTFNENINNWDVSNVTDMYGLFDGCSSFNQSLNNWDVSNVVNMNKLFSGCIMFNQPLNKWDVSSATNMNDMFYICKNFNQNINEWIVSSARLTANMFAGCINFNQSLSNWDVSSIIDMRNMFGGCINLSQTFRMWNINSNPEDTVLLNNMFNGTSIYPSVDNGIDLIDVGTPKVIYFNCAIALTNTSFYSALLLYFDGINNGFTADDANRIGSFNTSRGNISHWNVVAVTTMTNAFQNRAVFNENLSFWDVSNVTDMSSMFTGCSVFNQPLDNWDVSSVTNMSSMFSGCSVFNQPLDIWDVSSVTNMSSMFSGCIRFNQPLDNWDMSSVANMSSMFSGCIRFNQPLDNWDVSSVANMSSMFSGCSAFTKLLVIWVPPVNVILTDMFKNASVLTFENGDNIIDQGTPTSIYFIGRAILTDDNIKAAITYYISGTNGGLSTYTQRQLGRSSSKPIIQTWDVSNVTNMSSAFLGKNNFNENIDNWDVSNVIDMSSMFSGCSKFNQPLDNWDVSNVIDMSSMFSGCSKFNQPLDSWNVINVTNMSYMFYNCVVFDNPLDSWNVINVTNMSYMFRGCSKFNQSINSWNVSFVTNMSYMFYYCHSFTSELPGWDVSNVTDMSSMFRKNQNVGTPFFTRLWNVNTNTCTVTDMMLLGAKNSYTDINTLFILENAEILDKGTPTLLWFKGVFVMNNSTFRKAIDYYFDNNNQSDLTTDQMNRIGSTGGNVRREYIMNWNVSGVTDMSYAFVDKIKGNWRSIASWDVSNVTNMSHMFYGSLNHLDDNFSTWDVSNVTDMSYMFYDCTNIGYATASPLESWDVSNVTNMSHMFYKCRHLFRYTTTYNNQRDKVKIDNYFLNWDVSSVTDMTSMFEEASNNYTFSLQLWEPRPDVSLNNMFFGNGYMFPKTRTINGIETTLILSNATPLYEYFIGKISLTDDTFREALSVYFEGYGTDSSFNDNELLQIGRVTDISGNYSNTNITVWNVGAVTDMSLAFKGRTFNQDLKYWDVYNVKSMRGMFYEVTVPAQLGAKSIGDFYNGSNHQLMTNWYYWDVSNVVDMSSMFQETTKGGGATTWNTSNVTTMSNMFNGCKALAIGNFNNFGQWDVSKVTDMSYMFKDCNLINVQWYARTMWDVSNVTDMSYMFYNCYADGALSASNTPIPKWNVSNVVNATSMFHNCGVGRTDNKATSRLSLRGWNFRDSTINNGVNKMFNLTTNPVSYTSGGVLLINSAGTPTSAYFT